MVDVEMTCKRRSMKGSEETRPRVRQTKKKRLKFWFLFAEVYQRVALMYIAAAWVGFLARTELSAQ